MDAMEKYCCCVAGSRILVDDFKVTWNYRFSDPTWAQAEAEFLYEERVSMLKDRGLQVPRHGWWASMCCGFRWAACNACLSPLSDR